MIRLPTSVPPSYLLSTPVYSTSRGNTGRFSSSLDNPTTDYMDMDMSKMISFPDPPRPPTPGPPPRPPPIPPRPPVPTPPPSPSSEEAKWLQKIVAKQLSILAVRLVDIWFALDMPVSLPYPPRPPTPGPRPGPVNPRPDVPTPPPSPHRSSESLVYETSRNDGSSGIRGLDTAPFMGLFSEQLAFETRVFVLLKLTMSPYDSHKKANPDFQKELYDDKLTNGLDNAGETKLHTFIYNEVAPKNESDPHMSDLGSCTVSESSSRRLLHDGAGTLRKDPVQLHVSTLRQLNKARPGSLDALEDSSPMIMTSAVSGVYSTRESPMFRTKTGTYEISLKGRNDHPLYMRSSSRKSQSRVTMTIRSLGPHHRKRSYGSRISRDPARRGK
ncbi:hypothetical protein M434DRAFT_312984 [Hypoxylon sp. CO27-5]|nr:hypothetical protein M434DRAFT_312984 [Hypoxylon sp. CO27-5]